MVEFASVSDFRDNSSFGLNILGSLCLWQCFTPFPQSEIFQKNVVAVVIITTAILKSYSGSLLLWHYHHEGDFVIPVISNDLV